jgi:DNA-directed RNA polymerase specialized sigma24 family protein
VGGDRDRPSLDDADPREHDLVPLMIAYQAGRLDAFEALYEALAGDVRRFFAASVGDPSAALDLAQLTFLELHRARPGRRRQRRDAASRARREADAADARAGAAAPAPDVAGGVAVRRALAQLPESRRRAWILHHVHGFSFEEIGARLGIGAGAARLRSSRAMRGLRALLTGDRGRDDA